MILLKVTPTYTKIEGLEDIELIDAISDALSYFEPGYRYALAFKMGKWDGKRRLLQKSLKFPSGLLDSVERILKKKDIEYETRIGYSFPDAEEVLPWKGPRLYPYQEDAVDIALDKKGGMLKMATGAGKTFIISQLVAELNLPTVVYTVSLDLLSQMQETLESSLGIEVGVIGGGQCKIRDINVCSVWTAGLAFGQKIGKSYDDEIESDTWSPGEEQRFDICEMIENSKVAILDEAQFAAAASIQMILRNSKSAVYKYGFTATPWRTAGDDILLEAAFGKRIVDINASTLIDKGYLVPPKIAFRDMPKYPKVLPKKWPAIKSSYINNNDVRNQILIDNTTKLLEMGRRPLLLFRELAHGKSLLSMMPADVRTRMVTGRLSREERDVIRQEFKDGEVDCIIASTVYDQGIDIKELDALVLCAGGKSTAKALQRIGRVIRADHEGGKKDALIVETFDQTHYMEDHSIIRHDIYRTEPAFKIKMGPAMESRVGRRRK